LHEDGERLALLVQDDGVGFEPQRAGGCGLGLVNLHARATALGGELRITSRPGEGTRVVMTFPTRRPRS
jgi:signal transduction histidine kinase